MVKIRLEFNERDIAIDVASALQSNIRNSSDNIGGDIFVSPPAYSNKLRKYYVNIIIAYNATTDQDYTIVIPWEYVHTTYKNNKIKR